MRYQRLKGTTDILPEEAQKWTFIENKFRRILSTYYYHEIRLPIFEQFALFARGVGETSDIVSKEMYDFYDKGDRHIALRPEGTAGAARAFVENKLYGPEYHKPEKFFYIGPMFRYERPQSGRMRQFHQLGVEVLGSAHPAVDVEVMELAYRMFESLQIDNLKLVINSLGNNENRTAYREALIEFIEPHIDELSEDSRERLYKNPLRILDSKDERDQEIVEGAPSILDFLDDESREHFETVQAMLQALDIPYEIDPSMVRGLDYYNDTIFELMTTDDTLGSGSTICGGGRYDSLVEEVGGPSTPAFGFAVGMERVLILLEEAGYDFGNIMPLDAFVVTIGEKVNLAATKLVINLREHGLIAEREYVGRRPGSQFRTADRLNAQVVFTLGENELKKERVNMKSLASGKEISVPLAEIGQPEFKEFYQKFVKEQKVEMK